MSNERKHMLILTLLLINKRGLNNSYKLMRVLEWKFQVLDSKIILDHIKEEEYANYEILNSVHFYTLTAKGEKLLNDELDQTIDYLIRRYPAESEFILNLRW